MEFEIDPKTCTFPAIFDPKSSNIAGNVHLPESNKPLVRNMRGTLKEFVQKELEQIPETFKDLEPLQKFNVLCKLMPYVFPKVESISSKDGEPFSFD